MTQKAIDVIDGEIERLVIQIVFDAHFAQPINENGAHVRFQVCLLAQVVGLRSRPQLGLAQVGGYVSGVLGHAVDVVIDVFLVGVIKVDQKKLKYLPMSGTTTRFELPGDEPIELIESGMKSSSVSRGGVFLS